MCRQSIRRRGFTLIELLTAAAAAAVVAALMMPAIAQSREAARRTQCKNNLKQLGLALHNYHDTFNRFPYSATGYAGKPCKKKPCEPTAVGTRHTWNEAILPYMDQAPLYNRLDFNIDNNVGKNRDALENLRLAYQHCPSNPNAGAFQTILGNDFDGLNSQIMCYAPCAGPQIAEEEAPCDCAPGLNSYCAVKGSNWDDGIKKTANPGIFGGRNCYSCGIREITDGTSNTMLLGERRGELCAISGTFSAKGQGYWTGIKINSPSIDSEDDQAFQKNSGLSGTHQGGVNVLMADGAVVFLSDNIEFQTYNYLGGKADGQAVNGNF